jgi:hypothetical protein
MQNWLERRRKTTEVLYENSQIHFTHFIKLIIFVVILIIIGKLLQSYATYSNINHQLLIILQYNKLLNFVHLAFGSLHPPACKFGRMPSKEDLIQQHEHTQDSHTPDKGKQANTVKLNACVTSHYEAKRKLPTAVALYRPTAWNQFVHFKMGN